jgi:hypothetical protein
MLDPNAHQCPPNIGLIVPTLAKIRASMVETDIRGTAVEAAWIIQGFKIEEKQ